MSADHDEHSSERNVLPDHQEQLGDFRVGKLRAQLGHEWGVDASMVGRHSFSEAYGKRLAWLELAFLDGQMDLTDRLFIESLTRRRRVPGEASSVAFVDRRDLEPRELLDPRGGDAFGMAGAKELEELSEEFGDQPRRVESGGLGIILVDSFIFAHPSRLAQRARSSATTGLKCTRVG